MKWGKRREYDEEKKITIKMRERGIRVKKEKGTKKQKQNKCKDLIKENDKDEVERSVRERRKIIRKKSEKGI